MLYRQADRQERATQQPTPLQPLVTTTHPPAGCVKTLTQTTSMEPSLQSVAHYHMLSSRCYRHAHTSTAPYKKHPSGPFAHHAVAVSTTTTTPHQCSNARRYTLMLNISISVSFDAQASTGTRYTRLGVVALKPCTRHRRAHAALHSLVVHYFSPAA